MIRLLLAAGLFLGMADLPCVLGGPVEDGTRETWTKLGFPVDLDRHVRLTSEQNKQIYQFFDSFADAIQKKRGNEEVEAYVTILKWCLTPAAGDDDEWRPAFNRPQLRLLAGTPYAEQIIPLLRSILQSRSNRDTTRVQAAYNMAILGNKDGVEDVLPLLASDSKNVRTVARKALKLMGYDIPANFENP